MPEGEEERRGDKREKRSEKIYYVRYTREKKLEIRHTKEDKREKVSVECEKNDERRENDRKQKQHQ